MTRTTLLLLFVLCIGIIHGQSFKFDSFNEKDGLRERFIYTLNQDDQGYLLIGTSEGLMRYDGKDFDPISSEETIQQDIITCSYKGVEGIWFGFFSGKIALYKDGRLEQVEVNAPVQSKIIGIQCDQKGNTWIMSQSHGLIQIKPDGYQVHHLGELEGAIGFSFAVDSTDRLFLGTDFGLIIAEANENGTLAFEYSDAFMEMPIDAMVVNSNRDALLISSEGEGLFKLYLGRTLERVDTIDVKGVDIARLAVNTICSENEGSLWLGTKNQGLLKLGKEAGTSYKAQMASGKSYAKLRSVQTIFKDREKNIWIGTKGEGLLKLSDEYFSFFDQIDNENLTVRTLFQDDHDFWLGSDKGLIRVNSNTLETKYRLGTEQGLPDDMITTVVKDALGQMWAGTASSGLYVKPQGEENFEKYLIKGDDLNEKINDLLVDGKYLYVATDYGIYQIKAGKLMAHLTIQSGLPHNVISALYKDAEGRIWIGASKEQFTCIEDGIIQSKRIATGEAFLNVICFEEDENHDLWIGSEGNGVFCLSQTDTINYTSKDGLLSNYCYSIQSDGTGNLWIGHRGGLSKLDILTKEITVFEDGEWEGLKFYQHASLKDQRGHVWFCAEEALVQYNPSMDKKNQITPKTNIVGVQIGDSLYTAAEDIQLPHGNYKVHFNFAGLSFRDVENVTYEYFLEGFDLEWSDRTSERVAKYPRLKSGDYVFRVKSYNADGVGGEEEQIVKLSIDTPFWMEAWFYLICAVVMFAVVRLIIHSREQIMKENQAKLERALEKATKEVVAQKELIEIKNKDITDSIVYAKNIQKAMLPHPLTLKKFFQDAFVFFKPRDIVSGDFYWVDRFGDKIVVACADCTGHGVPGAFVSLISGVLLKGVSRMTEVSAPHLFLKQLDVELSSMLKDEDARFSVDDGMDVSVVEINIETRQVRISSAKRPVIIAKANELIEIKGDRYSIGGGTQEGKEFQMHEFLLEEGDAIYQFSDGLPDQFGGPKGKKLKKTKILELIQNVKHLDMGTQEKAFRELYLEWKGKLSQVDDIIFTGIRL